MINNELIEEVLEISKQNKIIDKKFINKLIFSVVEKLNYESKSKFNGIVFIDIDWNDTLATFNKNTAEIEIDYNKMVEHFKAILNDDYIKINLEFIHCILHEIQHLDEYYKLTRNDIQAKILRISTGDFICNYLYNKNKQIYDTEEDITYFTNMEYYDFYQKYWDIIPSERIADYGALTCLKNSLEKYPILNKDEININYLMNNLFYLLEDGYVYDRKKEKYTIPLFKYFEALDYKTNLENFGIKTDLSGNVLNEIKLDDKMKLGLPITYEEHEKLKIKYKIK